MLSVEPRHNKQRNVLPPKLIRFVSRRHRFIVGVHRASQCVVLFYKYQQNDTSVHLNGELTCRQSRRSSCRRQGALSSARETSPTFSTPCIISRRSLQNVQSSSRRWKREHVDLNAARVASLSIYRHICMNISSGTSHSVIPLYSAAEVAVRNMFMSF